MATPLHRVEQQVEQWFHISCVASEIFTLAGVHFFGIPTLLIGAIIVDLIFSILKYKVISPFNAIYWTVGHTIILWLWAIGTLIYFIYVGPWWMGAYALAYVLILNGIVSIPGMLIVLMIYFIAIKSCWKISKGENEFSVLASWLLICMVLLLQMAFLENWLEVSRLTVPTWLLFGVVLGKLSNNNI